MKFSAGIAIVLILAGLFMGIAAARGTYKSALSALAHPGVSERGTP